MFYKCYEVFILVFVINLRIEINNLWCFDYKQLYIVRFKVFLFLKRDYDNYINLRGRQKFKIQFYKMGEQFRGKWRWEVDGSYINFIELEMW